MPSFWTPSRDKRLRSLESRGHSAAQISRALGTTRNAVIGRSRRLRGIVYQTDIDSWNRANAKRMAEGRERVKIRTRAQREALRDMKRAVAGGMPIAKAMAKAFKAGAYWWQIGECFGMSQQAAYETAKPLRTKAWRSKAWRTKTWWAPPRRPKT